MYLFSYFSQVLILSDLFYLCYDKVATLAEEKTDIHFFSGIEDWENMDTSFLLLYIYLLLSITCRSKNIINIPFLE